MKQILLRYSVVFLGLAMGIAGLDYWNFPLSPINYLSRIYRVDLAISVEGVSEDRLSAWIRKAGEAEVAVADRNGGLLAQKLTDPRGHARFRLLAGYYWVTASLPVVQGGTIVFFETSGPLLLEVGKDSFSGVLRLTAAEQSFERRVGYLERLIRRGEFDGAVEVLAGLQEEVAGKSQEMEERLSRYREGFARGLLELRAMSQLRRGSYNSALVLLRRVAGLIQSLTGTTDAVTVRFGGRKLNPQKQLESVLRSRNSILEQRLGFALDFMIRRRYTAALMEYEAVLSDPELWREGQELPEGTQTKVDAYLRSREFLVQRVQASVLERMGRAIKAYGEGELDVAQQGFWAVQRVLRQLDGVLKMSEAKLSVDSYSRDISRIVEAEGYTKEARWAEALDAYTSVTNINPLVRQGIAETSAQLQASSLGDRGGSVTAPSDL